ncbi:MAG: lipoprotein [Geobacteraceae bacterium]|nr:lipoprotein [Geobacteraceae bacterium]
MKKALFLFLVLFLSACGKRGPLVPPEALVPAPIKDLRVEQKGAGFLVCWSGPGKQEWGGPLDGLAGFRVFRRIVLPPDQDCEGCPSAYRIVKTVDPEYLQDVRRSGSLYCFFDRDLTGGTTYQYKAVSLQKDGAISRDSNRARKRFSSPPMPPQLALEPAPEGVTLRWQPGPLPTGAVLEGFSVYRKRAEGMMPLNPVVLVLPDADGFSDFRMEHGVKYLYAVRSVVRVDGELVESELSNEVEGRFSLTEE